MIYISSNFTDEIQSHYDSSEADVLPSSSTEEEKIDKRQTNTKKNTIVKYYKEKQQQPYMCRICGKLFPTALISEDTKSLKDAHKQKPLFSEISSY